MRTTSAWPPSRSAGSRRTGPGPPLLPDLSPPTPHGSERGFRSNSTPSAGPLPCLTSATHDPPLRGGEGDRHTDLHVRLWVRTPPDQHPSDCHFAGGVVLDIVHLPSQVHACRGVWFCGSPRPGGGVGRDVASGVALPPPYPAPAHRIARPAFDDQFPRLRQREAPPPLPPAPPPPRPVTAAAPPAPPPEPEVGQRRDPVPQTSSPKGGKRHG